MARSCAAIVAAVEATQCLVIDPASLAAEIEAALPAGAPLDLGPHEAAESAAATSGGYIALDDNEDLLSSDIQAKLDEFKQQIIDGEITVPDAP